MGDQRYHAIKLIKSQPGLRDYKQERHIRPTWLRVPTGFYDLPAMYIAEELMLIWEINIADSGRQTSYRSKGRKTSWHCIL